MRNIVTISLQHDIARFVAAEVKKRGFPSTSAYIRHLIGMEQDMITERDLLRFDREARSAHKQGRTKKLHSLQDLM